MLELPEVITIAKQLNETLSKKQIRHVYLPTKPHKFCWFAGDAANYESKLKNAVYQTADGFGIYVELTFDNGRKLCFNDGVNVRFMNKEAAPLDYQLLIEFADATILVFNVAMYGSIILHEGEYDNEYYLKSKAALSPFTEKFAKYYNDLFMESKDSLSAKAFLATKQRFPGIGNGVLQDILLEAGIHPKRKIGTIQKEEHDKLLNSIVLVLQRMIDQGGRDTEKDLFGQAGGYRVNLSKNTRLVGCVHCNGTLRKDNYLGGAIYYCPACQKMGEV